MWRRGPWFHLALVLVNGLLLVAIIHVWWGGEAAAPTLRGGQGPDLPKAPLLRDKRPLDEFRVIATKTLFNSSRSGPDMDLTTAKGQGSLEGRQLLGTIIIGDERAAMIGPPPGAPGGRKGKAVEIQVVRRGEQLNGFKVVDISSEGVVFQGRDGQKTLTFPE